MGYPRFGMFDLLKLLSGLLVGLFQIACGSRGRNGISTPAACRPEAVRASKAQAAHADRLIFVWLYRLCPSVREAAVVFKP